MPVSVVLTTTPDARSAKRIAEFLIRKKVAACVSILGGVQSVYRWKGMVERSRENLLLIKTDSRLYSKLENVLKAVHPYDTPEIIALSAKRGSKAYLKWITDSVGQ